jgi:ATP-binding cassette subfamily B protein
LTWEAGPGLVVLGVGARIVSALTPLAILVVARLIVDGVLSVTSGQPLPDAFWHLVALELGIASVGVLAHRLVGLSDALLTDRFTLNVSMHVMRHSATLDLAAFEDPTSYNRLERARVQATDRLGMVQAIGNLIQHTLLLVSLAVGIWLISPLALGLLLVCAVPAFFADSHYAFLTYTLRYRQTPVRRELDYLRYLSASKESAKELKAFGLGHYFSDRYQSRAEALYQDDKKLQTRRFRAGVALTLLSTASYYGAYILLLRSALAGDITIGTLTFLIGAMAGASRGFQDVFFTFSSIVDQALYVTDLAEFFAVKPAITSRANPLPVPRPLQRGFEFRNVSFSYPGSSRPALKNVSFVLRPGERIALIGKNGGGKSTLIRLLLRLCDPTEGQIFLDGVDLREYDLPALHREVSVLFQDFMRYEMTVAENIGIGDVDDLGSREAIEQAARHSLADALVAKLPNGFDQVLGRRFEDGVELSTGEWQKLALARAYMRKAQLLILDEPTAALDAQAERVVFERLGEATRGCMTIFVSHRFSTVRSADRILVLDNGELVEEGNHVSLLAMKGRYSTMFEVQAAGYR